MLLLAACSPSADTGEAVEQDTEAEHIDLDGDSYSEREGDCDDGDAEVWPGATEYCNEKDDDCDGEVDEDAVDEQTWIRDEDGDGYGDREFDGMYGCLQEGRARQGGDCDDDDPRVSPGADEVCGNLRDDNCSRTSETCIFEGDWTLGDTGSPARFGEPGDAAGSAMAAFENTDVEQEFWKPNLAIAGRDADEGAGFVWIASSDLSYPDTLSDYYSVSAGIDAVANLGSALSFAEVSGDTEADLAIAAIAPAQDGRVAVYLVLGPITGQYVVPDSANQTWTAEIELSDREITLSPASDADGDGRADLLVGVPGAWQSAGAGWMLTRLGDGGVTDLESAWAQIHGAEAGEELGASIVSADVVGGGVERIVAGAPGGGQGGRLYVLERTAGPLAVDDGIRVPGATTGGRAGASLVTLGDLTGDGIDDIGVDAPGIGTVWLADGALLQAAGSVADAAATTIVGTSASSIGARPLLYCDTDDDGPRDLFVGDPATSTVWTLRGRPDPGTVDIQEAGGSITGDEEFGTSLACGLAYGPDEFYWEESNERLAVGAPGAASGGGAIREFLEIGQ